MELFFTCENNMHKFVVLDSYPVEMMLCQKIKVLEKNLNLGHVIWQKRVAMETISYASKI